MIFLKRLLSVSLLPLVFGCQSDFDKCYEAQFENGETSYLRKKVMRDLEHGTNIERDYQELLNNPHAMEIYASDYATNTCNEQGYYK